MSKLKLINAKTMDKVLLNLGFEMIRQKGSHVFYRNNSGKTTTVPFHSSKDLSRPLIRAILSEINLSIDEYNKILEEI